MCTNEEQEVLDRNSRKSETLRNKLMMVDKEYAPSDTLAKAQKHKEKLLEFDQTCEKRTQVREFFDVCEGS